MSAATALRLPPVRGELRPDEPLARHTTWRVGGPARWFLRPADRADLATLMAALPHDTPLLWLGLGSNLLVRDGGFAGLVVATRGRLDAIEMHGPRRLYAEAGTPCALVARFAARQGLTGAEFLAGIPGTLGGALAMNAGAFGGTIWPLVRGVETLDRRGRSHARTPADYAVGYRSVQGPAGEWFLAAELELQPGDVRSAQGRIRELLERRAATQPTAEASCGSVFRNPPGDHAARLIEAAGLKGLRQGGAQVSPRHANFIVNRGGATAADIEALIETVRERVARAFGIDLQTEVRIVGEARHEG